MNFNAGTLRKANHEELEGRRRSRKI